MIILQYIQILSHYVVHLKLKKSCIPEISSTWLESIIFFVCIYTYMYTYTHTHKYTYIAGFSLLIFYLGFLHPSMAYIYQKYLPKLKLHTPYDSVVPLRNVHTQMCVKTLIKMFLKPLIRAKA